MTFTAQDCLPYRTCCPISVGGHEQMGVNWQNQAPHQLLPPPPIRTNRLLGDMKQNVAVLLCMTTTAITDIPPDMHTTRDSLVLVQIQLCSLYTSMLTEPATACHVHQYTTIVIGKLYNVIYMSFKVCLWKKEAIRSMADLIMVGGLKG